MKLLFLPAAGHSLLPLPEGPLPAVVCGCQSCLWKWGPREGCPCVLPLSAIFLLLSCFWRDLKDKSQEQAMEATGCRLSTVLCQLCFVNFGLVFFFTLIKYENYFFCNNLIENPLNFSENLNMFWFAEVFCFPKGPEGSGGEARFAEAAVCRTVYVFLCICLFFWLLVFFSTVLC